MAAFLSGDTGLVTSLFLPCSWRSGLSLSGWWRTHHWNDAAGASEIAIGVKNRLRCGGPIADKFSANLAQLLRQTGAQNQAADSKITFREHRAYLKIFSIVIRSTASTFAAQTQSRESFILMFHSSQRRW